MNGDQSLLQGQRQLAAEQMSFLMSYQIGSFNNDVALFGAIVDLLTELKILALTARQCEEI